MLAAYGYRSGPGGHIVVGEFLEIIFDQPPADEAAVAFDNLRVIRNALRYRAQAPSRAETATASRVAETLLNGARRRLAT